MSAAMVFSPTATIHGPPNERPSRSTETNAITHEARVSIDLVSMRGWSDHRMIASAGTIGLRQLPTPLLRQRAEEIGGAEQDSWLEAELPEPAVKDLPRLAAAIHLRQRGID